MKFQGLITALVTPFAGGKVDYAALRRLIEFQIAGGVHGLLAVGTTGECSTLSHDEHKNVVQEVVDVVAGRVPVMAGAGSNSTAEAIEFACSAEKAGADALLVVCPYYNLPDQRGLYEHFKAVCNAVSVPVMIYNNPARTVSDMSVETMKQLFKLDNLFGLKDATGDLDRVIEQKNTVSSDFLQTSGNDKSAVEFFKHGGKGCISVSSNVAPKQCSKIQELCFKGDFETAKLLNNKLNDLHNALFVEPSPAPTKYALSLLGICMPDVRLPILEITSDGKNLIKKVMRVSGIL